MKYRKKSLVIEAIQFTGKNANEICLKLGMSEYAEELCSDDMLIPTLEGEMRAKPGDYIIKGISGEFYPCRKDIFLASYEAVKDTK